MNYPQDIIINMIKTTSDIKSYYYLCLIYKRLFNEHVPKIYMRFKITKILNISDIRYRINISYHFQVNIQDSIYPENDLEVYVSAKNTDLVKYYPDTCSYVISGVNRDTITKIVNNNPQITSLVLKSIKYEFLANKHCDKIDIFTNNFPNITSIRIYYYILIEMRNLIIPNYIKYIYVFFDSDCINYGELNRVWAHKPPNIRYILDYKVYIKSDKHQYHITHLDNMNNWKLYFKKHNYLSANEFPMRLLLFVEDKYFYNILQMIIVNMISHYLKGFCNYILRLEIKLSNINTYDKKCINITNMPHLLSLLLQMDDSVNNVLIANCPKIESINIYISDQINKIKLIIVNLPNLIQIYSNDKSRIEIIRKNSSLISVV